MSTPRLILLFLVAELLLVLLLFGCPMESFGGNGRQGTEFLLIAAS